MKMDYDKLVSIIGGGDKIDKRLDEIDGIVRCNFTFNGVSFLAQYGPAIDGIYGFQVQDGLERCLRILNGENVDEQNETGEI